MKIGLFVKDFAIGKKFSKDGIPTKSGAEFHAENHAKQLMRLGHHVTIMAKNDIFSREQEKISTELILSACMSRLVGWRSFSVS